MKIVTKGFATGRKRFSPPPSPDGFEWPSPPDKGQTAAFAAFVRAKLKERGMTQSDLAREIWGEGKRGKQLFPIGSASISQWAAGTYFPREEKAEVLAAYFDVPLAAMLVPKANGHSHEDGPASMPRGKRGALSPLPPRLPLPEGASPTVVKIETYAEDNRFVSLSVTGVLQLDVALSVMALVQPRDDHG